MMEQDFSLEENVLQQQNENDISFPLVIKWLAHFFSFIFHPLFIPVIATWYLAYIQPGYFTGISPQEKNLIILRVGYITIFYPALTVLLLKGLGFIKSIFLKTQRERIAPYIATNFFYFWMFLVFRNQPEVPAILTSFIFGAFLASSVALIGNIYFKISMHALGVGALCGLTLIIIFSGFTYAVFLTSMIIFLITGLVSTSRLIVSDHKPFDIYSAIILSILCQMVAYVIFG
jgi:membrane-associated HD superfamily phosphohydrolase